MEQVNNFEASKDDTASKMAASIPNGQVFRGDKAADPEALAAIALSRREDYLAKMKRIKNNKAAAVEEGKMRRQMLLDALAHQAKQDADKAESDRKMAQETEEFRKLQIVSLSLSTYIETQS